MIFNLLLTDPDNIPDGYGGYDLNNGGMAIIITLLVIILIMLSIILVLRVKLKINKENEKANILDLKQTDLSEEEKQTISEYRKLTEQERQIINDTIKTFNKSKDE